MIPVPINISLDLAKKVCDRLGISGVPVNVSGPLGGQVNRSFLIKLDNQEKWILRINGETQAVNKVQRETEIYRFLHQSGLELPVSKAYLPDSSKKIIPFEYALMKYLPGIGVGETIETLPQKRRYILLEQIGEILRKFHRIKVPGFGFRHWDQSVFPKTGSWKKFLEQDFNRELEACEGKLGYSPAWKENLKRRVEEWLSVQPEKIDPVFLHGDFHYDNLKMIVGEKNVLTLSGIFDLEWAWWGDPVADFLHLQEAFFLYSQDQSPFLSGYGKAEFPEEELKIHRVLDSLRLFRFWLGNLPEPDWKEVGIYEKRIRNLAEGKGVFC